jgi:hypothetical protein
MSRIKPAGGEAVDRRAKQLEKKRKRRALVVKQKNALAARAPSERQLLVKAAQRGSFGPCWVSVGWDELEMPELVSVLITRKLSDGLLLPGSALVDRTCLGVKDGFVAQPVRPSEVGDFVAHVGRIHGGMIACQPLVAQSVVFHAIDYARTLGFEPHPDFPAPLFGPRPDQLQSTPWHHAEKPWYMSGPSDDVGAVMRQLVAIVGAGNFDYTTEVSPFRLDSFEDHGVDDVDDVDELDEDDNALVFDVVPGEADIPADMQNTSK